MRPAAWIILVLYTALLFPVLTDFRAVMGDEAAYADPALRWCEGHGFTSTAWQQSPGEPWVSNVPLYALSLIAWVKVTGLDSLWGLRFFSLLLFVAGLVIWISGSRRAGWLTSSAQQAGFLALMLGSLYAMAPSQYIRPEALGVPLLAFALWGQTLSGQRWRWMTAAFSGFLAAWAGLQFVVALGVLGLVWLLLADSKPWRAVIACALGGVAGFAVLFAAYSHFGLLGTFLQETFGAGSNRSAQWHGWRDPMLWAASALLIVGFVRRLWPPRERCWALGGLLAGPGLALVFFGLSKFPQYYGVMAMLPLCTAVAAVFPALTRQWRVAGICLLGIAGLVGFPLSAVMNWNTMPGRQHADLQRWMKSASNGADVVFVDPAAYFAARAPQRTIYTQFVLGALSPEELADIDLVVLSPHHAQAYLGEDAVRARIGGDWRLLGSYPEGTGTGSRVPALDFLSRFSYAGPYSLMVWQVTR